LIDGGLRWALACRGRRAESFQLRDASVSGRRVRPGLDEGNWRAIREAIYSERGA